MGTCVPPTGLRQSGKVAWRKGGAGKLPACLGTTKHTLEDASAKLGGQMRRTGSQAKGPSLIEQIGASPAGGTRCSEVGPCRMENLVRRVDGWGGRSGHTNYEE